MAITPTVMIAASGMLNGEGVGVNSGMTAKMTSAVSDPVSIGVANLQAQASALAISDPTTSSAITAALSSMPPAYASVNSTAAAATSQAASMVPNVKSFINLQSSATAFGSSSAEYGAALSQFGSKSFGDLGIGVKGFTDVNSGGLTSLVPGLGQLAAKAKTDAFGGIGANLDPAALAKGQAAMSSSALSDGLKSVGKGISNFGTLFDFKNPQDLGYKGLVKSLQDQGLAGSVGINDGISNAGYDPNNLSAVPDSVLKQVLTGVTGSDLKKIVDQCNVSKEGTYQTAADLVDPSKIMPAGAVAALGLKPGAGAEGLKSLGNTFTNIGVPIDAANASKLLGATQSKVGNYLSSLTELVPQSISSSLKPFLGSGSSPFGTPSMSDMLGSVSGKHSSDFDNAGKQLGSIATSAQGQSVASAMNAVLAAIGSGFGLSEALTALGTATAAFGAQASSNASLSSALGSVTGAMNNVTSHMSLETSNLGLAGISLGSLPPVASGSGQVLSFASKLHSFGVDKLQIGHNDVMNGVATDGLTGDAIKAALLEGKNVAAMSAVGKSAPSVSNTKKALAEANDGNIDNLIKNYEDSEAAYATAKDNLNSAKAKFNSINSIPTATTAEIQYAKNAYETALTAWMDAGDARSSARDKMNDAAASAGMSAMQKANNAEMKYIG